MKFYNTAYAGGRWDHFMDQPHIGYSGWNDPPASNLGSIALVEPQVPHGAALGVAIEGSAGAWPGAQEVPALPLFDSINRQSQYIEVFDRGDLPFDYEIVPSHPWIVVKRTRGTAGRADQRHLVEIDWGAAPAGRHRGSVRISGAKESVEVAVDILKDVQVTREALRGFVENQGVVSIEPEHFSASTSQPRSRWTRIAGYGRTLSGMRAEAPVDAAAAVPGVDAACLEYRFYLFGAGPVTVEAVTGPTLNFLPGRALRYAVAIDDEAPVTVTVVPGDFNLKTDHRQWERLVGENARVVRSAHQVARAGYHTLRVWAVDSGVVLQKLIVDLGGLRPSYLGPPESLFVASR
jgi:endonuclease/exonuclease/phosphatase family metal-dependent hydrolase